MLYYYKTQKGLKSVNLHFQLNNSYDEIQIPNEKQIRVYGNIADRTVHVKKTEDKLKAIHYGELPI